MSNIVIHFRDGTKKDYPHEGRAGGSYTKSCVCTDGWVIVEDEWGRRTSFPADTVERVEETPTRW